MKIKTRFGALLTVTSFLDGLSRPRLGGHRTEGSIEIMKLAKAALAGLLAVPTVVGIPSVAYAESAPGCSGTVQIGTTAHIYSGGTTFASVKQFKGCGKNWAYLYVWAGYRSTHGSWDACVAVGDNTTNSLEGTQCRYNSTEIWSLGADTLAHCTQAIGWIPDGPDAMTSERC